MESGYLALNDEAIRTQMSPKTIKNIYSAVFILDLASIFLLSIIIRWDSSLCVWNSQLFYFFRTFNSWLEHDLINKCQIGNLELSFFILLIINVMTGFLTFLPSFVPAKGGTFRVSIIVVSLLAVMMFWIEGSLISETPGMNPLRVRSVTILGWLASPMFLCLAIMGFGVKRKEKQGKSGRGSNG